MRIAYLIMAHKNVNQVERLIRALSHKQFDFYIHLDKKENIEDYIYLSALPQVYFIKKRMSVRWASYQFIQAIMQGLKEILQTSVEYSFISLLSGQDYPIKPPDTIFRFFLEQVGKSFLSFEPLGSEWWRHAITRVEQYHTTSLSFKGQYILQNIVNNILPKRKFPLPYKLYGGSDGTWWTIGIDCATYLVDFMEEHVSLRLFCYFTWCPDEFLISTILMNSPFKDKIINDNYRYIDWSEGGANPKILTVVDIDNLINTHKLFARKFDLKHDKKIFDIIDTLINKPLV